MERNILHFLFYILTLSILIRCSSQGEDSGHLLNFDISPDGKNIVFAAMEGNESSIYKMDMDGQRMEILFEGKDSVSFFLPKFNKKGDSVIFIGSEFPKNLQTTIWIGDISGKDSCILYYNPSFTTEAITSTDGEKVFYLQSDKYIKYSPLGRKSPHVFDIYMMGKKNQKVKKLSDFAAYSLSDVSGVSDSVLLFSGRIGNTEGLFFFDTKLNSFKNVVIENDSTGPYGGDYSNPVYINDHTLLATIYYRLVALDLEQKKERTIFKVEGSSFDCVRYSKVLNQIFASVHGQNLIYVLSMEGEILKKIPINFNTH